MDKQIDPAIRIWPTQTPMTKLCPAINTLPLYINSLEMTTTQIVETLVANVFLKTTLTWTIMQDKHLIALLTTYNWLKPLKTG